MDSPVQCVLVDDVQMKELVNRQRTFNKWPISYPIPGDDLAHAGFYYVGPLDRVKASVCMGGGGGVLLIYLKLS